MIHHSSSPYKAYGHLSQKMIDKRAINQTWIISAKEFLDSSLPMVLIQFGSKVLHERFIRNMKKEVNTSMKIGDGCIQVI